jgi:hypothetical protein
MEEFGATSWQVLYLYYSFYAAGKSFVVKNGDLAVH